MRQWMAGGVAVLIAVGSALASEPAGGSAAGPVDLKIADDATHGEGRFSGIDYETSDRFHRAWLVLHYRYQAPCRGADGECELDAPVQVSVPGLTYDAAAKEVEYEEAGAEPVVCARVRHGFSTGFRDVLAGTGSCTTHLVKIDRLLDDGFAGRKDRREEIHFAVRNR